MSIRRLVEFVPRTPGSWITYPYHLALALWVYLRRAHQPRESVLLHEGTLCRLELAFYHVVIVPLIAFLPAPLAYGIARLQGNWRYRLDRSKREYIMRGLEGVLCNQMSTAERIQVTRDYFRLRSCEAVDVMRLNGKGRALTGLVEIRGMEHIEAALAAGKGAMLCTGHFGSYDSSFSLIGARGGPITVIGRWPSNKLSRNRSLLERLIFRLLIQKPLERHRHRPNIEPRGMLGLGVQAAAILRQNELISILIDPPVLAEDRARAVQVDFLNGKVLLLPGATTIAQLVGAPVLMIFQRRMEDWRHQILEISPPIAMDGGAVTAFKRCLTMLEAAIRENPAHWHYWDMFALIDLGLLLEETAKTST